MKRRFLIILLTLLSVICCVAMFSACNVENSGGNGGTTNQTQQGGGNQTPGGSQTETPGGGGSSTTPGGNNPGGGSSTHTHEFSNVWSSDEVNHWHAATCGHTDKKDEAPHTYVNGVCSTCNHAHENHNYGNYTADDSNHTHTCTVCKKSVSTTHTYVNGVCSTCNHAHENHSYGNWIEDTPASETATGSHHKDCFCGNRVTEETPKIVAFEFRESGNGYAVTAYTGSLTELTVPSEHEGKPVTVIAENAFYDGAFTSIKLPTSLKEIGKDAFGYCTQLNNIEIPNCSRIGDSAFEGCAALQEITLPEDAIFLGSSLFKYCSALKNVTIKGGAVQGTTFLGAETVEEIILEENVNSIAQSAFESCKNLQKLTMPRVATGSSFMRYYFNTTVQNYTLYRTEDGSDISDLYPDEVVSHQYGNHIFSLPKDHTSWYYDGKTLEVDGATFTYDGKPVIVSSWKRFYDITANTYWYGPKSWSATFYRYPETSLKSLIITNQKISVFDKVFEDCKCKIDIWEKFPVTKISVIGAGEFYIDYFAEEDYKLRVEYEDGFKEDFPLFGYISQEDQAAFRTAGSHEITATYQDKTCTATINVLLHQFEEAVLENAEYIFDGSPHSLTVMGAPEGTDIVYTGNGQSEVGEYTITAYLTKQYYEPKTLTATLSILKQQYDISYELGLDGVTNNNPANYTTNGQNVKLQNPVRLGWEFLGWYTEESFSHKITEIKGDAHQDYALYAKWQTVFTLSGGTITGLTDYGKQQTELVIDEIINGTKITSIGGYAFEDCTSLTSITIPDSVTSIGGWAFSGCKNLTGVYITDLAAWCNIKFSSIYGGPYANPLSYANNLYLNNNLLTEITADLLQGVTSIGDWAFDNCTSLESIAIPDSITSIGESAFKNCTSLTVVYITDFTAWCNIDFGNSYANPLSYANNLYLNNNPVTEITADMLQGVTEIKQYAFYKCTSLESIAIPDSITSIGESAFSGCTSLASIAIPDSITSIGSYAFSSCTSLESITIPDSVTSIGQYAFSSCTKLMQTENGVLYVDKWVVGRDTSVTNVNLRTDTKGIANSAFSGCKSLKSITISDGVTSIGNEAFYNCKSLTSITIPDSVTSIGVEAFAYCKGLGTVYWNAINCKTAGSSSCPIFSGCTALTTVYIGENVGSIPYSAFEDCTSLTSVYITDLAAWCNIEFASWSANPLNYAHNLYLNNEPVTEITADMLQGVTEIKSYAFRGFGGTSITIPNSVTSIGRSAFENCTSLESVTIGNGVTSIGSYAFWSCTSLESVYITDLKSWCNIEFGSSDANPLCYAHNLYLNNNLVTNITADMLQGVTEIKNYAFCGFGGTSITIPDSVTSIGEWAFAYCTSLGTVYWNAANCKTAGSSSYPIFFGCTALTNVYIGGNVGSIPDYAFYNCSSLESITIPDSVTSIGYHAFYNCTSLGSITIPDSVTSIGYQAFAYCESLTSITIPNSVTSIGRDAFWGCKSLTSITIPESVTSIGSDAFYKCTSLTTVYYGGNQAQWSDISNNHELENATRYYFSETEPDEDMWAESDNWWHYDPVTGEIAIWKKD